MQVSSKLLTSALCNNGLSLSCTPTLACEGDAHWRIQKETGQKSVGPFVGACLVMLMLRCKHLDNVDCLNADAMRMYKMQAPGQPGVILGFSLN